MLLLLANFGKEGKPEPVIARISQEMLAEMVGTTRARVSFFMNKFRKLGFIDYNGDIEVHSSLLNVILHDQPLRMIGARSLQRPDRTTTAYSSSRPFSGACSHARNKGSKPCNRPMPGMTGALRAVPRISKK